jgi:hypothetical protein
VELFARCLLVAIVTLQAVSPLASVFFIPNEDGLGSNPFNTLPLFLAIRHELLCIVETIDLSTSI